TVELDGHASGISERRLAALEPGAKPGMVVRFAVFDGSAPPAVPEARERALDRLKAREPWLVPAEGCPANLIPAVLPESSYSAEACRGGRLLECLNECQRGAASFCYAAAQELQPTDLDRDLVLALFLRSCHLGYASGCTNAAAARLQGQAMDR